jgi:LuxR family maltose regulon positive regulatory protein
MSLPPHTAGVLRGVPDRILALTPGDGLLIVVSGPAGSGKSRSARELAAALPGWTAVRVAALAWEKDVPSSLAQHVAQVAGAPGALRRGLDTPGKSTALIVDDAHWADRESLRTLVQQSRRMHYGRLALILTCADGARAEAENDLDTVRSLADLTVTIPPLSVPEIQGFVQSEAGVRLDLMTVQQISRATGGRPGRIRDLLAAVPPEHWTGHSPSLPVPAVWRSSFDRRTTGLSAAGRRALDVVGVFTDEAPLPVVLPLTDDDGLSEATEAGLLMIQQSGRWPCLVFCDPADRQVVQSRQSLQTLAGLHRRIAEVFRDHGDEGAALEHAAVADAMTGAPATAGLLTHADGLAWRGLWRDAARQYQLAAALEPRESVSRQHQVSAIEALISASDIPAASLLASSLDRGRRSAHQDSMLGYLALHEGRRTETVGLLTSAADEILGADRDRRPDGTDPAPGKLASRQVLLNLVEWDIPELVRWAGRADRWSTENSGDRIESAAIGLIGRAAISGELPEDSVPAGESPVQADRRDMAMGWLNLVHDDPLSARQRLRIRSTEEGSERIALWKDAWFARTAFLLGDFAGASAAVERGLDRSERYGIRFIEPILLWSAVQVAHLRGDTALAAQYSARIGVSRDSFVIQRVPSAMSRMLVAYNSGELVTAARAGEELVEMSADTDFSQPGFWPWEDVYAQVLLWLGRFGDADRVITGAEETAAASGLASLQAKLLVPRGNLLLHRGEPEKGIRCLDEAVEAITPLGMPAYEGRILYEYGQILRRLGQWRRADDIFSRASETFAAMGARHFVALCDRERRAGGLGPRRTRPGDLTPQEEQIAGVVATGATNREVARELFLSTKTVEYHLTRIFRKLEIRNRGEVAAALGRR